MPKAIGEWVSLWIEKFAASGEYDIQFCPGYSEPGYTQPSLGVLLANWNGFAERHPVLIDMRMPGSTETVPHQFTGTAGDILEKFGYGVEWSDEWTVCDDCSKAVRTSPDSMCWTPSYYQRESEIVCKQCALDDMDSYIESLQNRPFKRDTWDTDFSPYGWLILPQQFAFLIDPKHPERGQQFILADRRPRPSILDPAGEGPTIWIRRPDEYETE